MTPEEANAQTGAEHSGGGPASSSLGPRPSGRGRHSRGRRRPRRSTNRPRRAPMAATADEPRTETESPTPLETREPLPGPFQPARPESMAAAIEKVTAIIGELREVLNDMELVLEYLEDAERQQIADEREIESLQQRLNVIHRRTDRHQPPPSRSGGRASEEAAEAAG